MIYRTNKLVTVDELAEALRYHVRTVYRRLKAEVPAWADVPRTYSTVVANNPKITINEAAPVFGLTPHYLRMLFEGRDSLLTIVETADLLGVSRQSLISAPTVEMIGRRGFRKRYSRAMIEGIARQTEVMKIVGEAA